jgi:hypothetical protein
MRVVLFIFFITASVSGHSQILEDTNRFFSWSETNYPQFFSPAGTKNVDYSGYLVRYYEDTNIYLATRDGAAYYSRPDKGGDIIYLGSIYLFMSKDEEGSALPLSAFFGLDNNMPFAANALCFGASGEDGMPVVLSHTVNPDTLQAEDFRVVRQSGATSTPICVSLRPANDIDENRTVLLIGEFGNANDDPPVKVLIVGDLLSDATDRPQVNFRDTQVSVIPLDAGPEIILAAVVPEDTWSLSGQGTSCPIGTKQVVRVTWTGGVRLPNGDELGEAQRALYKVILTAADGSQSEVSPAALAELGDNDNNHFLCLATTMPATAVAFSAGHLVDPNGDLNVDSKVMVRR